MTLGELLHLCVPQRPQLPSGTLRVLPERGRERSVSCYRQMDGWMGG